MHHKRFNVYAEKLREAFPRWTAVYKDPNAVGAQFLSVMGTSLEEVEWFLNYAYEQQYVGTADIHQADIVYRAQLPVRQQEGTHYRFRGGTHTLEETTTVEKFLDNPLPDDEHYGSITFYNPYYIDPVDQIVYVRKPYGKRDTHKEGVIEFIIFDNDKEVISRQDVPLSLHHVWNFFDEFGLMLGTPRLYGERNASYKGRILDVFRRPANSTRRGLVNGIARELGLIRETTWQDRSADLPLRYAKVDAETILINDHPIDADMIHITREGQTVLKGERGLQGIEATVRYAAGIEIHALHDKDDTAFRRELYHVDGTATNLLQYYVDTITDRVPIKWGQWRWDQGIWDPSDEQMTGYGMLPSISDAGFASWKGYIPNEGGKIE